jgi:hypothetical protein
MNHTKQGIIQSNYLEIEKKIISSIYLLVKENCPE